MDRALSPDEEQAIIRQCQAGELDAFGLLVIAYQDRLLNVIVRLVDNRDDAIEIAQDSFVKAMQSIKRFRLDSSFYTWLFRIATNHALSVRRRRKKFQWFTIASGRDDEDCGADLPPNPGPQPFENAIAGETGKMVSDAIASLDEDYKTVIVLRDIEEMSYEQISEVLSVPIGTVKSRIFRGREILKDKLTGLV